MFDHVKFGVSDFALSKAFFLNALAPLGVRSLPKASPAMASNFVPIGITCHCACFKPMKNRHTCTWHLPQAAVNRSMRSTTPR